MFLFCDKSRHSFVCKVVFFYFKVGVSFCQIIQLQAAKRGPDSFISAAKATAFQGVVECFRRGVRWAEHCGVRKAMEEEAR